MSALSITKAVMFYGLLLLVVAFIIKQVVALFHKDKGGEEDNGISKEKTTGGDKEN